jgi:hypothetical protein
MGLKFVKFYKIILQKRKKTLACGSGSGPTYLYSKLKRLLFSRSGSKIVAPNGGSGSAT